MSVFALNKKRTKMDYEMASGQDGPFVDQNGVRVTLGSIDHQAPVHLLTKQVQEIIVPSYSAWFAFPEINAIEQKALPEFFNNRNRLSGFDAGARPHRSTKTIATL